MPVFEVETRSCDEILDCARHAHFAGLGTSRNTRTDVDGNAADLAIDQLAFTGVQSRAHLQAWVSHLVACRACTPHTDEVGEQNRCQDAVGFALPAGIVNALLQKRFELSKESVLVTMGRGEVAPREFNKTRPRSAILLRATRCSRRRDGCGSKAPRSAPFARVPARREN
jgi:hypothetical protein